MIERAILCALLGFATAVPAVSQSSANAPPAAAHLKSAAELLRSGKPDLALNEFREALKLEPNNAEAHNGIGTLLYFQGQFPDSAAELRAALKANPSLTKTLALLGMCERRMGQPARARANLEKAFPKLTEEKLRVEAGLELIEIYYGGGDLDKAAGVVNVLRQLRPNDPAILHTAHRIHSQEADEDLLGIAMLAPNSAQMHEIIATDMIRHGNTDGAIPHLREALKLDPRIPGLHFELAEALNGSSTPADQEQAEQEYRASLAQNPFDEKSECRLGRIAAGRSDLKEAYTHYARALELQPDDAEANLDLGKILVSMDQPEKARPLFERAVRLEPYDAVAHFRLGTVYRQLGRTEDSRRELMEFQRIRKMKDQLRGIYKEMRLQMKPEPADADLPR